jgi:pyridoxal 5'-phosphate synthase pdxS subunit
MSPDTLTPVPTRERPTESTGPDAHALHVGLARMLCGGVILDVTSRDQARIAEDAGAERPLSTFFVPSESV